MNKLIIKKYNKYQILYKSIPDVEEYLKIMQKMLDISSKIKEKNEGKDSYVFFIDSLSRRTIA